MLSLSLSNYNEIEINTGIDLLTTYKSILLADEVYGTGVARNIFNGINECSDKLRVLETIEKLKPEFKIWELLNISREQYIKIKKMWKAFQGKQSSGELKYFARMANNHSMVEFLYIVASDNPERRIEKYEAHKHELH